MERETFARGGESFDSLKGTLGEGQSAREVSVGGQGWGKPVSQPSNLYFGEEVKVVRPDAGGSRRRGRLGRSPLYELSFGNREE